MATATCSGHVDRLKMISHHRPITIAMLFIAWLSMANWIPTANGQGTIQRYTFYIAENQSIGTIVGNITQTDLNDPRYTKSTGSSQLNINSTTGIIYTTQILDREVQTSLIMTASITPGPRTAIITVHVNDVNDNQPVFQRHQLAIQFSEIAPNGSTQAIDAATDPDTGANGRLSYTIQSGNINQAFALQVQRSTSTNFDFVSLMIIKPLDREHLPFYQLTIQAEDGGQPSLKDTMIVNVTVVDANDNRPTFNQSQYNGQVVENATIGTVVLRVYASDRDAGNNAKILYSIISQPSSQAFSINSTTGQIQVQRQLDYESRSSYGLTIGANNPGDSPTTSFVTIQVINIIDKPPVIALTYYHSGGAYVNEDAKVNTKVIKIDITQIDSSSQYQDVILTLTGGQGYFQLNTTESPRSWLVVLQKLLDRETQSNYTINITAYYRNQPTLSTSKVATIHVQDANDNSPVFNPNVYSTSINESVPIGTKVVTVKANDRDQGANAQITYSIVTSAYSNWFAINSTTGMIKTVDQLDYDVTKKVDLIIQASDGLYTSTCNVNITILDTNDNPPYFRFQSYSGNVDENAAIGTPVITVQAIDPDTVDNQVTYSMSQLQGSSVFTVGKSDGVIRTVQLLDRETINNYTFYVVAQDQGGRSAQVEVRIQVNDINDNRPIFNPLHYNINLRDIAPIGQLICTLSASDQDQGNNAIIRYQFLPPLDDHFRLNSTTGQIFLERKINHTQINYTVLLVQAIDNGNLQSNQSANVSISIVGPYEQPPIFDYPLYNFTITENQPIGSIVGIVSAKTSEQGTTGQIRYSISQGDPQHLLKINQTGYITTQKAIDRETVSQLTLTINAKDSGLPPLVGQTQAQVQVNDINDNYPQFDKSNQAIQLFENTTIGTVIYQAIAHDKDSGQNGQITYGIVENFFNSFAIDSRNGNITLMQSLDRELVNIITLNITATDRSQDKFLSWMLLTIQILDNNDNAPQFKQSHVSVNISEASTAGTLVYQVKATDPDAGTNSQLSYSFVNVTQNNHFDINTTTGRITIKKSLDYENRSSYTLFVKTQDAGHPPRQAILTLDIHVLDENDHSPQFQQISYNFGVSQGQPIGTWVGQVDARDDDTGLNAQLTYQFLQASAPGSSTNFSINPVTGIITTKTLLDRTVQSIFNLTVIARDQGITPRNATTEVIINVGEVNNYLPVFAKHNYPVSIVENVEIGTLIVQVQASDKDIGKSGSIVYAILDGNPNNTFIINATTGRITTHGPLDAEKRQYYRLNVTATDEGATAKMDWCTVQVNVTDVDDNIPTFTKQEITIAIKENIPLNTTIVTVKATDADVSASKISYLIQSGNVGNTFMIDRENGKIINLKPLNYELIQRYTLLVEATNHVRSHAIKNTRPDVVEVTIQIINVNDNAPAFDRSAYYFGITENSPLGSKVNCVNASDKDLGQNGKIRYGIVNVLPVTGHFIMNATTGCIYTAAAIDHENVYKYDLIASATDQAVNISERKTSLVNVVIWVADQNDNAPRFIGTSHIQAVNEDESVGTTIAQIIAVDDDSRQNNNIEYHIVEGDNEGKFALDVDNGVLSIASKLDYERKKQYALNISATDKGIPRRSSYMKLTVYVVDVNDHAPTFNKTIYTASINENVPLNTFIASVAAYDRDTGKYGKITYSIPSGIANDTFKIDSQAGRITTAKYLDREQHPQYILTVDAHDNALPSKYSSTQVVITVLDINDNPPQFSNQSHTFYIPENFPPTKVDRIIAVDKDKDSNSRITYSIVSGNVDNSFLINPQTGELSTTKSLNRERIAQYQLTVMAKDNGSPSLNSTTKVTVIVTDQNDHDPKFNQTRYSASIAESVAINTTVTTVYATDADSGPNQIIRYSIIGTDNVHKAFTINPVTGRIATAARLDRETIASYNFLVNASDMSPFGIRTAIVSVDVRVTDVNDVIPTFTQVPYVVNISSSTSPQTFIISVQAIDNDFGSNGQISYSFDVSTSRFSINSSTGVIKTIASLADRPNYRYTLRLIATDHGNPALRGTGYVEVNVGNFALNKPQFNPNVISTTVPENSPSSTFITKVQASNVNSNSVTYSITSGNTGNAFAINAITGDVTVADSKQLDYEINKSFNLIIVASINSPSIVNGYLTLQINLTDVNDNRPRFKHEYYHLTIDESTRAGMAIYPIVATDRDSNEFALIRYEIVAGNLGQTFGISERSGQLYTMKNLDYEKYPSFDLIVKAYDYNDTTLYSTCSVRISVIDMNDSPPLFHYVPPVNISENTQVGTIITLVTASDSDVRSNITYSFKPNGNGNDTFSIDSFRGLITLARRLDYERITSYELIVQATDQIQKAQTILIVNVLDYNDNAPVFDKPTYEATLQEFSPPHQPVVTVHATDQDSGDNSRIVYSIEITSTNQFYINSTTGTIYTDRTIEYNPNMPIIQLVITARDNGFPQLIALVPVRIQITDVNDKAPVFDKNKYIQHVPENVPIGTEILQVHATDLDRSRRNSIITYSIISGNNYGLFEMNNISGIIKNIKRLNVNGQNDRLFVLTLQARDQGTVPQSGYVTAEIYLDDANSHAPKFNVSQYQALVTLDANKTDIVIKLHANDQDHGANGQVKYSIISGNNKKLFQIQPTTGIVTVSRILNQQDIGVYNLTILASDGAAIGTRNSTTLVTITISKSPQAPRFSQQQYFGSIAENSRIGSTVMTIDANSSTADKITYKLIANPSHPSDDTYFQIHSLTGIITLAKEVDTEKQEKYYFQVEAEDNYVPPNRAIVPVIVTITGENEFPPKFEQSSYLFHVLSNFSNGDIVGKVIAHDFDAGRGSEIYYFFMPTSDRIGYLLNSTSGQIILNRTGEYPQSDQRMYIRAGPSFNSTIYDITKVDIQINATCIKCPTNMSQETLIIIIALGVALLVSMLIIVLIVIKVKYWNKRKNQSLQGPFTNVIDNQGIQSSNYSPQNLRGHDNTAAQDGSDCSQLERGLTQVHRASYNNDSSSSGRGSSESHLHDIDNEPDYDEETGLPDMHRSLPADLNTVYHSQDNINLPLGNNPNYLEDIGKQILNNSDADLRSCLPHLGSTHNFTIEGGGEFDGQDLDFSTTSLAIDSLEENDYDDDGGTSIKSTTKPRKWHYEYTNDMISKKELLQGDFNPSKFEPNYNSVKDIVDDIASTKTDTDNIEDIDLKGGHKLSLKDKKSPKTESSSPNHPRINYNSDAYQSLIHSNNRSHMMSPLPPSSTNIASPISTMDSQIDLSGIITDSSRDINNHHRPLSMQHHGHMHPHRSSYHKNYRPTSNRLSNSIRNQPLTEQHFKDSDEELSEASNHSSINPSNEYYGHSLDSISHNNNSNRASSTMGLGNPSVHSHSDIDSDQSMITRHDGNYPKGMYSSAGYNQPYYESNESCLEDNFDSKDDTFSSIPLRVDRNQYSNSRLSRNINGINATDCSRSKPKTSVMSTYNKDKSRMQTTVNPVDNMKDRHIHHRQHSNSFRPNPVQMEMTSMRSSQRTPSMPESADAINV